MSVRGKMKLAITATTGMASSQLGVDASTLHHWAGILDGRYEKEQLQELFDNDDRFAAAKKRILGAECLIIDEISMLSKKTFELVEFVCRHVRSTQTVFGGLQLIGSGDFKQLPPVPNHRLQDDGAYCLESELFRKAFPHHVNLTKVVRQEEPDLVRAVHELCDGTPSEDTIKLLTSLNRPLPEDVDVTRLYGTNFDVSYVNHEQLEAMAGQQHTFKAVDEGPPNLLRQITASKTLLLKEGAPVMLIRNIQDGLFNGARGIVHELKEGSPPVILINGKKITLAHYKFDVYDSQQRKVLAHRTQYPIMLAFAMTVHRAQGQTIEYVDVDCASFFAAGQMGVAIGRVQSKSGLRVQNFNRKAANLKHAPCVYDFYSDCSFVDPSEDKSCCFFKIALPDKAVCDTPLIQSDVNDTNREPINLEMDIDLPQLPVPWDIDEFFKDNKEATFISCLSDELRSSEKFEIYVNFLYFKVNGTFAKAIETSTNSQWYAAYGILNKYLTSAHHIDLCKTVFEVDDLTKEQNKFSAKLIFWLLRKQNKCKADEISSKQLSDLDVEKPPMQHSSAGESKVRYIAGACISKIGNRLRQSVLRKVGKTSKKTKLACKFDYKKQAMLKKFRICEEDAPQNETMLEIDHKQGPSKGLTIVSDDVFHFFITLNNVLQQTCSYDHFHFYGETVFNNCRNTVDVNDDLINKWINLFQGVDDQDIEDEIFLILIMELFRDVTEHFIRVAFVDSLKSFKASVPRKKKQALRSKVKALGEREVKQRKTEETQPEVAAGEYICNICKKNCDWDPGNIELESIACDKCNCWYHYKCANITGKESFLKKETTNWYCCNCSRKGKGRGKATERGKGRGKKK